MYYFALILLPLLRNGFEPVENTFPDVARIIRAIIARIILAYSNIRADFSVARIMGF